LSEIWTKVIRLGKIKILQPQKHSIFCVFRTKIKVFSPGLQRESIPWPMVRQKYFKDGGGWDILNIINNNLENFREQHNAPLIVAGLILSLKPTHSIDLPYRKGTVFESFKVIL